MTGFLSFLECPECQATYDPHQLQTVCRCGSPLLARYDLERVRAALSPDLLADRPADLWRYAELLPVQDPSQIVTLGEGGTPLLRANRLAEALGMSHLYIKDESGNPTGSFKARGLAMAVSRARELGVRSFVIPTAGNAGGALAAYAARAGLAAHVFMPADAPPINQIEVRLAGATLHLVEGLISDAGREAAAMVATEGGMDVSTLKEPYRLEGKKTMGYEIVEQMGWQVPDVILYPTGGGTGLIGIWKAMEEMAALGWIDGARPRMVAVQAAGCAPIVKAFHEGAEVSRPWPNAHTLAAGLRVPKALGDRLILRTLRESGGTAVAVSDDAILEAQRELAEREGLLACPEGAATLAALHQLLQEGWIAPHERVVLLNTGSGLKYAHLLE
ncbi:MAG: threonine synthase [Chloroflexi bacterium]|nr:MAG: threonine synthase [Chloroflexota bacterium]